MVASTTNTVPLGAGYEVGGVTFTQVLGFTDGDVGFDELVDISAQDEWVIGSGVDFHVFPFRGAGGEVGRRGDG